MRSQITSFKLKSFERVLRMNDDLEYSVIIPLRNLIELLIFGTQPGLLNQWQTPLCQTLLNAMKVFRNALLNPSDPMYNIVINLNNAPQANTIIQMTNWYIKILDQQIVALNGNTLLTRMLCQTLLNAMKVFRNALLNPSDPMYNIVINLNNAPPANHIIDMINWYINILDQQILALDGNPLLTQLVPNVNGQQIQIGEFARNAIHIYREAFQNAIQDEFAADQVVEKSQLANADNGANASSGDSA